MIKYLVVLQYFRLQLVHFSVIYLKKANKAKIMLISNLPTMMFRRSQPQTVDSLGQLGAGSFDDPLR